MESTILPSLFPSMEPTTDPTIQDLGSSKGYGNGYGIEMMQMNEARMFRTVMAVSMLFVVMLMILGWTACRYWKGTPILSVMYTYVRNQLQWPWENQDTQLEAGISQISKDERIRLAEGQHNEI